MEPYHHHPLDYTRNEIRLFTLVPGSDPTVAIMIVHVSLDEKPQYEALSYAWGDPTITEPITICQSRSKAPGVVEYELQVTVNLAAALRQLRDNAAAPPEDPPLFWADAICINQKDDKERGHQVSLMSRIYKQCSRVCIWLGEASGNSDTLMTMAIEYGSNLYRTRGPLPTSTVRGLAMDVFTSGGSRLGGAALEGMVSLVSFFVRPWFRRLWILQEVVLSPSGVVLCGSRSVEWESLWRFLYFGFEPIYLLSKSVPETLLESFDENDVDGIAGFWGSGSYLSDTLAKVYVSSIEPLVILTSLQACIKKDGPRSLRALLSLVIGRQFTDPRDAIYALLSMAADTEEWDVNYAVSLHQVFSYATSRIIRQDQSLDIICHAGSCLHNSHNLRSWLPRFDYETPPCGCTLMFPSSLTAPRIMIHYVIGTENPPSSYNASKYTTVDVVINDDVGELRTCGAIVDSVDFVSEKPIWEQTGKKSRVFIPDQWFKIALGSVAECGVERMRKVSEIADVEFEELWRTLVADRWEFEGHQSVAPNQWGVSFKAWINALGTGFVVPLDVGSLPECLNEHAEPLMEFAQQIQPVLYMENTLVKTAGGRLGLARHTSIIGDVVCILKGCSVPMIIRPWPTPDSKKYVLIGEAYIHGFMDGEMVDEIDAGKFHWEEITIV